MASSALTSSNLELNYGSTRRADFSRRTHSLSVDSNTLDFIEPEWAKKWKAVAIISLFVGTIYLTTTGFQQNWYGIFEDWAAINQEMVCDIDVLLIDACLLVLCSMSIKKSSHSVHNSFLFLFINQNRHRLSS